MLWRAVCFFSSASGVYFSYRATNNGGGYTNVTTKNYPFERYLNVRNAYGPSFSPDGKSLSFLTDITGVAEVWSVPVELASLRPAWPEQLTFRGERVSTIS